MTNTEAFPEHTYALKDIVNFASTDPRGEVDGHDYVQLPEAVADQLNYARALNGNPHRLIKVDIGY